MYHVIAKSPHPDPKIRYYKYQSLFVNICHLYIRRTFPNAIIQAGVSYETPDGIVFSVMSNWSWRMQQVANRISGNY